VYKKLPHKGTALKRKIKKGAIHSELHLVFYKFKKSQLGTNTEFDFEKYMNTSGKLYHATNLDDFYGKAWTVKQDSCTSYIQNCGDTGREPEPGMERPVQAR